MPESCYYCGTKKAVHCCAYTDRLYKDRIIALFRDGSPTNEQLEEMAEACQKQSEEWPEKMRDIDRQIFPLPLSPVPTKATKEAT